MFLPNVSSAVCFGDFHVLDTVEIAWLNLADVKGDVPSPRTRHGAAVVDNILYVFGGTISSKGHWFPDTFNFMPSDILKAV